MALPRTLKPTLNESFQESGDGPNGGGKGEDRISESAKARSVRTCMAVETSVRARAPCSRLVRRRKL
eukprot:1915409-Pleurochrysis_carterae.AAC.1